MARYSEKQKEFFREQLRLLRKSRGFTKAALSRELGLSEVTVGTWENGKSFPAPYAMRLLCEYFQVSEKDLVGRAADMQVYALYNGDVFVDVGTLKELSRRNDRPVEWLRYNSYDSTKKRRPNGWAVVRLEDD